MKLRHGENVGTLKDAVLLDMVRQIFVSRPSHEKALTKAGPDEHTHVDRGGMPFSWSNRQVVRPKWPCGVSYQ